MPATTVRFRLFARFGTWLAARLGAWLPVSLAVVALWFIGGGLSVQTAEAQITPQVTARLFHPDGNFHLQVPYVDPPDNGDNFLWGATIEVQYSVVTDPPQHDDCTQETVTQRYRVDQGGSTHGIVRRTGDRAQLVNIPANAAVQCSYVANWQQSFTNDYRGATWGPYVVSGNLFTFKQGDARVTVDYAEAEQDEEFVPVIPFDLPDDERPGSPGTSQFQGATFRVRIRVAPGSPAGCSAMRAEQTGRSSAERGPTPLEPEFTVQRNGSVAPTSALSLVDVPVGAAEGEHCVYDLWYPPSVSAGGVTLVLSGDTTGQVSEAMAAPAKVYRAGTPAPTFTPTLNVIVPFIDPSSGGQNILNASTIYVDFAPLTAPEQHDDCTPSDFEWVQVSHKRSGSNGFGSLASRSVVRPMLVSTPIGATEPCVYTATFAASLTAGSFGPYPIVSGQGTRFSQGDTLHATYADATPFSPMLNFTVPSPSPGADSQYVGAIIRVDYVKSAGPAGCSDDGFWEYVVDAQGMVAPRATAPSLIGSVTGETNACQYAVAFPTVLTSAPGAATAWVLRLAEATASATLSAAAPTHARAYEVVPTFTPSVSIGVPQIDATIDGTSKNLFSDVYVSGAGAQTVYGPATFQVDFARSAGPDVGCLSASTTFTVQAGGTVTGDAPALVDRLTATGPRCEYGVTFQSTGLKGGLSKSTAATDKSTVTGESAVTRAARATYANDVFDGGVLSVDVTAPTYAGTARTVDATVRPRSGEPAGCLVRLTGMNTFATAATATVSLDLDGATSVVSAFDYVDFAAGATSAADRCEYDVNWSSTEAVAQGSSQWQRHSGTTTFTGTGRVEPTGVLRATYGVGPPQEVPFDATLTLAFSPRVAAGTTFSVQVRPASSQDQGCSSAPPAITFTAPAPNADGSDATVSEPVAGLIDQPARVAARCEYEVVWPTNESVGTDYIRDPDFAVTTVLRHDALVAQHRYIADETTFDATLNLVAAAGVPAGITFDVAIAAGQGGHGDCSSRNLMLAAPTPHADGTSDATATQAVAGLVDFPAGETHRCVYAVRWPDDELGAGELYVRDDAYAGYTIALRGDTAATRTAAARYELAALRESTFTASIEILAGSGLPVGTVFAVRVDVASGPPQQCSPGFDLDVAAGRSVSRVLIDSPAGTVATCSYTVTWPETEKNGSLHAKDQMFTPTVTLNAASRRVSNRYFAIEPTFPATIGVVAAGGVEAGTVFNVRVVVASGPPGRCSPDFNVDVAVGTKIARTLIDRPAGLIEHCTYEATWPAHEVGGADRYIQDPDFDESTTLSIDDVEISHRYVAPTTRFAATLEVLAATGVPTTTQFNVGVAPSSGSPNDCTEKFDVDVSAAQPHTRMLVNRPSGQGEDCTYDVTWPAGEKDDESDGTAFAEDDSYADKGTTLSDAGRTARNRYVAPDQGGTGDGTPGDTAGDGTPGGTPGDTPGDDANPGDGNGGGNGDENPATSPQTGGTQTGNTGTSNTPTVNPSAPTGGGTSRRPITTGGGRTSGGSGRTSASGSGGGTSGGSSSGGGGATGPWVVAATSRVPVAVSLAMPQRDFAGGTAIEVMLNVPGTCGDDVTAFAGLPANIGIVYALNAQSGTTADVLAADALRLAGYVERGEQTRDCALRITLISAPAGCTLSGDQAAAGIASTPTDAASTPTDDAGRPYVELTGGADLASYAATPALVCS